jgi:Na+/H+ antiporter NhaD/arsenite permease-like protein
MFFYGVVLCAGGMGFIGYLEFVSQGAYGEMGATFANLMVGFLSAIVNESLF